MRTTITIRAGSDLRSRLRRRAESEGKTMSDVVREILERDLMDGLGKVRIQDLRGRLTLPRRSGEAWRIRLRARNWRP